MLKNILLIPILTFARPYWVKDIGLHRAKSLHTSDQNVTIALIDSGVDLKSEALDPTVLWTNNKELNGVRGVDDDGNGYIDDIHGIDLIENNPERDYGYHGTFIAGLLMAKDDNKFNLWSYKKAYQIMVVKVIDGSIKNPGDTNILAEGIRYACDNGAQILSNSYGSPSFNLEVLSAIQYCESKGVLFISAAGNSGKNIDVEPDYPSNYGQANQIVVGASDQAGDLARGSNFGQAVDLMAPGADIRSLVAADRVKTLSGTSFSAPLVAMGAAMVWSEYPELNYLQVKKRLLKGANSNTKIQLYSNSGAKLDIANALKGRSGYRFNFDFDSWNQSDYILESSHPYPYYKKTEFSIKAPSKAKEFRVHLERFEVDKWGMFTILNDKDQTVMRAHTEQLPTWWSPVITGNSATIRLEGPAHPQLYGFRINKIQWR